MLLRAPETEVVWFYLPSELALEGNHSKIAKLAALAIAERIDTNPKRLENAIAPYLCKEKGLFKKKKGLFKSVRFPVSLYQALKELATENGEPEPWGINKRENKRTLARLVPKLAAAALAELDPRGAEAAWQEFKLRDYGIKIESEKSDRELIKRLKAVEVENLLLKEAIAKKQ